MSHFLKILLWGGVFYALYLSVLFFAQRQLMYPRYLLDPAPVSQPPVKNTEAIRIETGFGRVDALYLKPEPASGAVRFPIMIVAHGNAEQIDYLIDEFRPAARLGMGVLLVEYPGYGRSEGSPSQKRIAETFLAAYDLFIGRSDVDASRIVLFGRSLGGGAACILASHRPSAALILVSTFTSARSFAKRYLAPGRLVRDPYDNLSAVMNYTGPVLVVHGTWDDVIPYRHGAALADAAPDGRIIALDCAHNDCPPDPDRFWRQVAEFLEKAGVLLHEETPLDPPS